MRKASAEFYAARLLKRLRLRAITDSTVSPHAHIYSGSHIVSSQIGRYTQIGYDCKVVCTRVGSFCSIASNVIIGGESHPMDFVSTSTAFLKERGGISKLAQLDFCSTQETVIGHDVWIGNYALIKAGVKIGNGAVIGMGSVVTRDVPAYEVWAGNPARCIRRRFDEETAARLEKTGWWDMDEETLQKLGPLMNDPAAFLAAAEQT